MAALAGRLGCGVSVMSGTVKINAVPSSVKFLAVAPTAFNKKDNSRSIYSKTSGMLEERVKPHNYKKYGFDYFQHLFDTTTKRFNDNSKLVVVEGPPGLKKTKFAEELADELDMLYIPGATMDHFYTNPYGFDLREIDHLFTYEKNLSFDEKKFAQNPNGQSGGLDRMLMNLMWVRLNKYTDALAHIFNTGQGVVTEKSPFSEHVYLEAAYNFGWVNRSTRNYLNKIRVQTLMKLLRPNLIVYLDAPVDVVQSKIRERAKSTHPWEKNSPVYENTKYLTMLYENMLKGDYINKAAVHSKVLMYDWSEGGETEVVVEDIERLNLDYFDKYDKQQADWRMFKEENYARSRILYTQKDRVLRNFKIDNYEADNLIWTAEEMLEFQFQAHKVPGNMYTKGFNAETGDSVSLLTYDNIEDPYYFLDPVFVDNANFEGYMAKREAKRAAGEANYWNF